MAQRARLFVYGDHLGDKIKALQKANEIARTQPLVKSFLHRATIVLRDLTGTLTLSEREKLGEFVDLLDVATTIERSSTPLEAASFALTVTAQVTELLQ
jgi:hypothetical protein